MTDKQVLPGAETKVRTFLTNNKILIGAAIDRLCMDIGNQKASSIQAIWSNETGSAACVDGGRS